MTKGELINNIAKDAGISQKAAARAFDSFITNIIDTLKEENGRVTIIGFGAFSKVYRKARKGRNPQTGETIEIEACNRVKFKAGKGFKEAIN